MRAQVGGDGYPEFARRQFDLVVHGTVADTVVVDGLQRSLDDGRVTLSNDGTAFTVGFEVG